MFTSYLQFKNHNINLGKKKTTLKKIQYRHIFHLVQMAVLHGTP